jgi:hypothetical protein
MSLTTLPDLSFPVTSSQVAGLMNNVVQLNFVDAGLNQLMQRAIGILLDTIEIYAKSGGRINYLGKEGQARLFQDAMTFAGPQTCLATRKGDLQASHLAIDWNNATKRLQQAGLTIVLPNNVSELLDMAKDLIPLPSQTDDSIGVLIRYLQKK